MKKYLILVNGKSPKKKRILPFIEEGYKLVCADGGANSAYKLELLPDFIVGDFDSIKPRVKKFYKDFSTFVKIKDQDRTDTEKALEFVIKNGAKEVLVFGVNGNRSDHVYYNIQIFSKFAKKVDLAVIEDKEVINFITQSIEFETEKNERISLFCMNDSLHVKSNGLKYELNGKNIASISNKTVKKKVILELKNSGSLMVVRELK